jgi:Fur family transcriptional regulator, ferric uptake regulator
VDVKMCLPTDQFATLAKQTDFAIEGHTLTIFGLCATCRTRGEEIGEQGIGL